MAELPTCYGKAIDLLARRAHFRRELAKKLSSRDYSAEEVDAALERLVAEGLIDDPEVARDFTRGRLRREPQGRRRLYAELVRRGVDSEVAREAVDEVCPEDDTELAEQAAQRWLARRPQGEKAALARFLERRGFTSRAIFAAIRHAT